MGKPSESAPERRSPLPHVELQILLQLASRPAHGYEMMKAIAEQTDGKHAPGPGTLYVALRRLSDAGLICETGGRASQRARRRYRLTTAGKSVLADELRRLSKLVRQAEEAGWRRTTGKFAS